MDKLCTDTGYVSLNKKGEQLCGDRVEIIARNDNSLTLVLADGLGSGVKANILSTLTSKILSTMIENGMPIEECVDTIVKTLPVCSVRKVAYSTFTIIHVEENTTATLIQFDNPNVILLRGGKHWDYPQPRNRGQNHSGKQVPPAAERHDDCHERRRHLGRRGAKHELWLAARQCGGICRAHV